MQVGGGEVEFLTEKKSPLRNVPGVLKRKKSGGGGGILGCLGCHYFTISIHAPSLNYHIWEPK